MVNLDEEWRRKGATLRRQVGAEGIRFTQDEILTAIDAGQLQVGVARSMGTPG